MLARCLAAAASLARLVSQPFLAAATRTGSFAFGAGDGAGSAAGCLLEGCLAAAWLARLVSQPFLAARVG